MRHENENCKNKENLYNGDMRADNLYKRLRAEIENTVGGLKFPMVTCIGVLEKLKFDLIKETYHD